MYYNKVEICSINTSKLKTLTHEQSRELLKRSKAGDRAAREELISGNLRLVLSIISHFSGKFDSAGDLFQIGCIGLIKAVDNFNTELDVKFSTYAVPMIIGEVRRYLRDSSLVRVSRSMRDLAYKALSAREKLAKESGREPSVEDIAAHLKKEGEERTPSEISAALEAISDPLSLYDPVYSDKDSDSIFLMDQIKDESCSDEAWLENIALYSALSKLDEREKKIINMRFFKGRTQMEIASEIGISQAQVSRLEKGALGKMRKEL